MSAGVLGAIAGVGPGYTIARQTAVDESDAKLRREKGDRAAEKHTWWKQQAEEWRTWREAMDNPDPAAYDTWFDHTMNATGALVNPQPAQPAALPPSAPQNAVVRVPGMADGGPVEVGPPAALAGPAPSAAAPVRQPNPQRSWRDKYQEGYTRLGRMALLNGGLEGLQKFEEMENATARRQILGYAQQAAQMMNEGNVGEAMRAGNAALERTPFDTGLKFETGDGQLFLVGQDGTRGQALKTADLMAFTEQHMKTPESYLDWKKQAETARSNKELEGYRHRVAGVSERQVALDEEYRPQEADNDTLRSLAAYENSQANRDRATTRAAAAAESGWDANNILAIERDSQKWVLDNFDPLHGDIDDYFKDNPVAWIDFKNDVLELQLYNPWDENAQRGSVGRDAASIISQLIRQPGGVSEADLGLEEGDFVISDHPDAPGELYANYKGQIVALPKVMHNDARKNYPVAQATGGGGKEQAIEELPEPERKEPAGAIPVVGSDEHGNTIIDPRQAKRDEDEAAFRAAIGG